MIVGVDFIKLKDKKRRRRFSYKDVVYNSERWADASKYLPLAYDLVYMKTSNKVYVGWWTGSGWDGYNYSGEEILFWKKKSEGEG